MERSFTDWLIEQAYRNDLVGDLAETVLQDEGWPDTNVKLAYQVYLHQHDATPLGRQAFQTAYEEWQKSKHLPAINMWTKPAQRSS